jgi:MinD superfamily P-loop ATPase
MARNLTVAVASGKGGTGKTTISTNLACAAAEAGYKTAYLDCDVEEPNGHLFLKPLISLRYPVCIPVPEVNMDICTKCGVCGEICQYSAIIKISKTVLTFDNMCHGCGGCLLVCPAGAITEKERRIGVIEEGYAGRVSFRHGRLNIGEALSPPLIKAVRKAGQKGNLTIVDAPPGTSCPVIAAVRGVDYILLITEPTPFGLHDLGLALDMLRELEIPGGVVLNRSDPEYNHLARDFCRQRQVPLLAEFPDSRKVAEAYSVGELAYYAVPGYQELMQQLLTTVEREVTG